MVNPNALPSSKRRNSSLSTTSSNNGNSAKRHCTEKADDQPLEKFLFQDGLLNGSPDVVEGAAKDLALLLQQEEEEQDATSSRAMETFVALGGLAILVADMKKWKSHTGILYWLLRCLWKCTYYHQDNNGSAGTRMDAVIRVGGLEELCSVLEGAETEDDKDAKAKADSSKAALQLPVYDTPVEYAMACLVNLIVQNQRAVKQFVHELNGISLICKTMKEFDKREAIQKGGCYLLSTLMSLEVTLAKQEDALTAVLAALKRFPKNKEIALFARNAASTQRAWEQRHRRKAPQSKAT